MCATLLEELTEAFASNRIATGRAIRELRESDPRAFREAAVHVLRTSPESPGSKYLLTMLVVQPDFIECICDPERLSFAESVALIRRARTLDSQVEVKLAKLLAKLPFETDQ